MNVIAVPTGLLASIRANVLGATPRERAVFLVAAPVFLAPHYRFLVREIVDVPDGDYAEQSDTRVVIPPTMVAVAMKKARREGLTLILTHSHPQTDHPEFSRVDDHGEADLAPSLFARLEHRAHASIVFGREGFDARLRTPDGNVVAVERLDAIGPAVLRTLSTRASAVPIGDERPESDRWSRNLLAFGAAGQRILEELTVGIVGLGGTGSIVAEQLAHLGVRSYVLLDPDIVDLSNTNRVIGSEGNVGLPKVESAARLIKRIQSDARVSVVRGLVHRKADAISLLHTDFLFCCTDSHGSRAVVNQLAYQYLIPTVDVGIRIDAPEGSVSRVTGRAQMLAPGLGCLVCQQLLDPEQVRRDLLSDEERARDPYIVGPRVPQPAVISLNSTVASLGVTMMLASVTGMPLPARHQNYLADRGIVRAVSTQPKPGCIVCSTRGALARGDTWRMPWRLS